MKAARPFCAQTLWLLTAGWILLALFVGETELLAQLPPFAIPGMVVGITVLLLAGYAGSPCLRSRVGTWSDRTLVAVHLSRFVGIYFLMLSARGELEAKFAVPAGWGDIAIALGAVLVLGIPDRSWLLWIWNCLGLADILLVVGRAASLRLQEPDSLQAMTHLPLSFLPTFFVPLIIVTHIILFIRLKHRPRTMRVSEPHFASPA